jgi:antitoxin StbD
MNAPFKPEPLVQILADVGVTLSELKKNPTFAIEAARSQQVAVLGPQGPVAYIVSPNVWDHILDVFDERKLVREMGDRLNDLDLTDTVPFEALQD